MKVQLVEVEEIIIHMVLMLIDDEYEAREEVLAFDFVESETLSSLAIRLDD